VTTLNLAAGVTNFSVTHRYTFSSIFLVGMRATDDDGGSGVGFFNITVNPLPPAAPSNLTAIAVSKNEIDLSWTDNSNNETGFEIERCDKNGRCILFALLLTVPANVTAVFDFGLVPASSHTYRVRAVNAGGPSAYSNTATAKTPKK
jgi:titin